MPCYLSVRGDARRVEREIDLHRTQPAPGASDQARGPPSRQTLQSYSLGLSGRWANNLEAGQYQAKGEQIESQSLSHCRLPLRWSNAPQRLARRGCCRKVARRPAPWIHAQCSYLMSIVLRLRPRAVRALEGIEVRRPAIAGSIELRRRRRRLEQSPRGLSCGQVMTDAAAIRPPRTARPACLIHGRRELTPARFRPSMPSRHQFACSPGGSLGAFSGKVGTGFPQKMRQM
jgi:hypothetical protein